MTEHSDILLWLLGLPLFGCLLLGLLRDKLTVQSVRVFNLSLAFILAGLTAAAITSLCGAPNPDGLTTSLQSTLGSWISSGSLNVTLSFSLDPLSSIILLLTVALTCIVHLAALSAPVGTKDSVSEGMNAHLFLFGILALILAKNLLVLFLGWECVALCAAYLFGRNKTNARKSKTNPLTFMRIGSFALLIGIFLVGFYSDGDLDLVRLEALFQAGGALDPLSVPGSVEQAKNRYVVVTMVSGLFLLAALSMSAQFPLHTWFTDDNDMPASSFTAIHACTMTAAGVYLLCRLNAIYAINEEMMTAVTVLGAVTAVIGATSALAQTAVGRIMTFLAVSQLGFVFVAFGVGAFEPAIFQFALFALFMPCLFLASDLITRSASSQHIADVRGSTGRLPVTRWIVLAAGASLAGLAPLPAFFAKDQILTATLSHSHHGAAPQTIVFGFTIAAALLSGLAIFRFYCLAFGGPSATSGDDKTSLETKLRVAPMLILLVLSLAAILMGVTQLSSMDQTLSEWLSPVFAGANVHFVTPSKTELGLPALVLGAGGYVTWLIAHIRYRNYKVVEPPTSPNKLTTFFAEGWYLNRVLHAIFALPFKALSNLLGYTLPRAISRSERGLGRLELLAILAIAGATILLIGMA